MKHLAASLSLALAPLLCHAAAASDALVDTLLTVSQSEALLDSIYANIEQNMRQGMAAATAGKTLTDEQQRALRIAPAKFAEVMRQEFNWATLKPIYMTIYKESFSAEEIEGLIAFYRSPTGVSFVNKMPAVTQRSMAAVQSLLAPLGAKMRAAMEQAMEEAKLPR